MKTVPLLLAAVLLVPAGCGGDDAKKTEPTVTPPASAPAPPSQVATVSGRLLAVGGPAGTDPRPLAGTVSLKGPGGSDIRAEIGDDGRYAIQVPPGEYTITGRSASYQRGRADCTTDPAVTTLETDSETTADVLCPER